MEDLDALYEIKYSIEDRLENYFGNDTMPNVHDQGYQDLLERLSEINTEIENFDKVVLSAEELLEENHFLRLDPEFDFESIKNIMIKFAKLHVEAALKDVSKNAFVKYNPGNRYNRESYDIDEDSILNAYPLENIK